MKILLDTLEPVIDTWDDPGDYPNAVASGPLPSYQYLAGVGGKLIIQVTGEEFAAITESESLADWLINLLEDYKLPKGIESVKWQIDKRVGPVFELSVSEAKADSNYKEDPYDSY